MTPSDPSNSSYNSRQSANASSDAESLYTTRLSAQPVRQSSPPPRGSSNQRRRNQLPDRANPVDKRETLKRGILTGFNPQTYTANVLIMGATSAYLQNIPVACHLDGTSAQINSPCAILFFDEQNYTDAVLIAVYPNATQGIPTPPPGRLTFVPGYRQLNAITILAGNTVTYQLSGGSSGIPAGAVAIACKVAFTSPTAGAFLHLAPHGASDLAAYLTFGTLSLAGGTLYGSGLLPLDNSGRADIQANGGNCTLTLYSFGYIF